MNNTVKCQSLFAFKSDLFKSILSDYEYPWDILPHLKNIIYELIERGIAGYTLLCDGVLIGSDVNICKSVYIDAPAIIGHGTSLRHGAYLRGGTLIGSGCVIGNSSEIKNSILMDHVQVPHYNYVGDSILGEGVHLGAGAICSNLRSDKGDVGIKCDERCIDTGIRKLGAIVGDYAEIGCGAVLCPGTVIGKCTTVYPLTLARGVYPHDSLVKQDNTVIQRR